jgi:hypothetical protein
MRAAQSKPIGDGTAQPATGALSDSSLDFDHRLICIATLALDKAKRRGFTPGYEKQDWLNARAEFEEQERPH